MMRVRHLVPMLVLCACASKHEKSAAGTSESPQAPAPVQAEAAAAKEQARQGGLLGPTDNGSAFEPLDRATETGKSEGAGASARKTDKVSGPPPKPAALRLDGALIAGSANSVLRAVVMRHIAEIRVCFDKKDDVSGRLYVTFGVEIDGKLSGATPGAGSTIKQRAIVDCVTKIFGTLQVEPARSLSVSGEVRFSFGS